MSKLNLPMLNRGAQPGEQNHAYKHGRVIDLDGYALVIAPDGHPFGRSRATRKSKRIVEHRLLMEQHIGRFLLPTEVVDHIDGLRLHNKIENLRLFSSNAQHLRETLGGHKPNHAYANRRSDHLAGDQTRVDTYRRRKKSGDARLLEILLAVSRLGPDEPCLSGSHRYMHERSIDPYDDQAIEQAILEQVDRWELDLDWLLRAYPQPDNQTGP